MPEALARTRHDSILSRPARRPERAGVAQTILRRLMTRPARTIAGAALTAVMVGVVVNALVLQKGHRVAPAAAPIATPAANLAPAASPPAAASADRPSSVAAQPPARPVGLGALIEATAPHSDDPIRDLIRADQGTTKDNDSRRLTLAAQTALIKLGYQVKADGVPGASTQQAIQQFERGHGFIPLGEITPRMVKELTAAAAQR